MLRRDILFGVALVTFVAFSVVMAEEKERLKPVKEANDTTNNIVYLATHVEFKDHEARDKDGNVVEGLFYEPFLDGESLGPHRASPNATVTVLIPKDGKFDCPKELKKRLVQAKALRVARLESLEE